MKDAKLFMNYYYEKENFERKFGFSFDICQRMA